MTGDIGRCESCIHWAPMLRQNFLGICGFTKQCTDKTETCDRHENGNTVQGKKIEEYLE